MLHLNNGTATNLNATDDSQDIDPQASCRPVKRLKADQTVGHGHDSQSSTLVRRHPLGVRPSGNALTSRVNLKSACGLFAQLPDELLMQLLETLNVPHLLRLGSTCKALHAFTRSEELWRALFVE